MVIVDLQTAQGLQGQMRDWAYNALDVTGTREIADNLIPLLTPATERTYAFERALQAPAMSMMMRGVRVDVPKRNAMSAELKRELVKDERNISRMPEVTEKWDGTELDTGWCPKEPDKKHQWPRGVPDGPDKKCKRCGASRIKPLPFSPNSEAQAKHLFYHLHGVQPILNKLGKISTDGDTLEKIGNKHPHLRGLTDAIASVKDKVKQLGSINARLGPDNRYYSSFNVGAAWTGRFSSSKNPFQLGGNLQNWAERHRRMAIPDVGMDIGYADYMQGESNVVAHLSGDEKYIEAHALGDVHTYATRLIWPDMDWTGDLKLDKKIAKQLPAWDPVEGHDFRFQSKRIQHGSNYGLTPFGISMIAHIPLQQAKKAQEAYFYAFDGIPAWHDWVKNRVEQQLPLVNPLGRTISLFGRPWDKKTHRQGLAFLPQSLLADIEDIALWYIWKELEPLGLELLAQVHDAMLHQFTRDMLELETRMLELMRVPVPVTDIRGITRTMTIGVEAAVGRNWGHRSEDNLYGIKEI